MEKEVQLKYFFEILLKVEKNRCLLTFTLTSAIAKVGNSLYPSPKSQKLIRKSVPQKKTLSIKEGNKHLNLSLSKIF